MTYGGRVFIGGISSLVTKDHIENEFGKFGKLRTVWLATKPPGFAFVEYDDDRDAEEAVKSLNGLSVFNENKIRVEISKKRPGGQSNFRGRNGTMDRGSSSGPRSNPSFRSSNAPFKPRNPRFSNSSSMNGGSRNPPRGGHISGSAPRFNNQLSGRPRQGDDQNPGFQNSRPSGRSFDRSFGSGPRRPHNESGGFFSGNSGSGYKGGFRNRQMD